MKPIITMQQMRAEKEVIKKVYTSFTDEIDEILRKQRFCISLLLVNQAISNSIKKEKLTREQKDIVEGFFDTYVGGWHLSGRETVDQWAGFLLSD